MAKKKSKRDTIKYPNLTTEFSLKRRRDFIDNRHYVDGVKVKGVRVMQPLDDAAKEYLDQFNKEYYGASFDSKYDYDKVHKCQIDEDSVKDVKGQIRALKLKRKKIFTKSPNTTSNEDRELAGHYTNQIEDMEEFLNRVHPRRACEHDNNHRNNDFLNCVKASNEFKLVSWEELTDDVVGKASIESCFDVGEDEDYE